MSKDDEIANEVIKNKDELKGNFLWLPDSSFS